jgi:Tfp pilus assembly protein PilZ
MADKRDSKRKIKRLPITFLCGTKEHRGISSNFSARGLFIKTRKTFKPGLKINLVLEIDENFKIALRGVIVREIKKGYINPFSGIGVALTEIPQAYRDFLEVLARKEG